jgi:hypothetical protein
MFRFFGLGDGYGFGMSLGGPLKLAIIGDNQGIQTATLDAVPPSDPRVCSHIAPHSPSSSRTGILHRDARLRRQKRLI